ncbi:MAG: UDP-N-acetylmuramyl-tripeptide synthetase [Polyangiaceae bacterium]|nr:UDP-N-acetylmuramyl-tripeptide synthetase [Polyangiaceae bacterium]MCW5790141.1 UDP-N-acetylmuramyl-tripeptide synthetase [Polyangiaceae bacterium]
MAARFPPPPPWSHEICSIGVTGTNGKTSTTSFLAAMLEAAHAPVIRATTLGMFLGTEEQQDLPKSHTGFLKLAERGHTRGARYAALEVTSQALARGFAQGWPFRAAIFTNLTHDHLDAHDSPEHYFASKAQLFVHLPPGGFAIVNGADEAAPLLLEVTPEHVTRLCYGAPSRGAAQVPLDVSLEGLEVSWGGTRARLTCHSDRARALELPTQLELGAVGEIYLENAVAALLAAAAIGIPAAGAARLLKAQRAPRGRFEVVHEQPYVVIDYAHSPDALERTLATARSLTSGKLTAIFGAGGNRDAAKRPAMGRAARVADQVVLTTDNPRDESPLRIAEAIATGLQERGSPNSQIQLDRALAIQQALAQASPADTVVIAGKGHEAGGDPSRRTLGEGDHELVRRAVAAIRS